MPMCGFNPKILEGLALFAQGVYESALRLAKERDVSIEDAMEIEIREMGVFLAALDERYDELRKTRSVDVAMVELAKWTEKPIAKTPSTSTTGS